MTYFLLFTLQNFDPSATVNDGRCTLPAGLNEGCTCEEALNFDKTADLYDGSCIYPEEGCTYKAAWNFERNAVKDDGSCTFGPLNELGEELHTLRQQLRERDEALEEKDQMIERLQFSNQEKGKAIGSLKEELSTIKQEKEGQITNVEDKMTLIQQSLEKCQSDRINAQNERQRFQLLLQQCQSTGPSFNETEMDGQHSGNQSALQVSTQVVEFSRREHIVKLPKSSVQVVLKRTPSSSKENLEGRIGTVVQSIDRTAEADIDFSPIYAFLIWEPQETEKTISVCIKTSPSSGKQLQFDIVLTSFISPGDAINVVSSLNSTTTVYIVGRESEQHFSSDIISQQQRIWWAHWSRRLKKGFRP